MILSPIRIKKKPYYWSGRRVIDGHVQIRLARVETDSRGEVLRTRVVRSS